MYHKGAAFLIARYPVTISDGRLRIVENSEASLYRTPVLGSLYFAWKQENTMLLFIALEWPMIIIELTGNPDKSEYFLAGFNAGGASILPSEYKWHTK